MTSYNLFQHDQTTRTFLFCFGYSETGTVSKTTFRRQRREETTKKKRVNCSCNDTTHKKCLSSIAFSHRHMNLCVFSTTFTPFTSSYTTIQHTILSFSLKLCWHDSTTTRFDCVWRWSQQWCDRTYSNANPFHSSDGVKFFWSIFSSLCCWMRTCLSTGPTSDQLFNRIEDDLNGNRTKDETKLSRDSSHTTIDARFGWMILAFVLPLPCLTDTFFSIGFWIWYRVVFLSYP